MYNLSLSRCLVLLTDAHLNTMLCCSLQPQIDAKANLQAVWSSCDQPALIRHGSSTGSGLAVPLPSFQVYSCTICIAFESRLLLI